MSKQILLLAGAALLVAGVAQADATEADATEAQAQERSILVQKEAPVPSAGTAAAESAEKTAAVVAVHPDAKPVSLSGQDCGSN